MATFLDLAKSLYPNMPEAILNSFANEWAATGDSNVAISNVRQTQLYRDTFPGNTLPNGQVRFDEVTYQGLK